MKRTTISFPHLALVLFLCIIGCSRAPVYRVGSDQNNSTLKLPNSDRGQRSAQQDAIHPSMYQVKYMPNCISNHFKYEYEILSKICILQQKTSIYEHPIQSSYIEPSNIMSIYRMKINTMTHTLSEMDQILNQMGNISIQMNNSLRKMDTSFRKMDTSFRKMDTSFSRVDKVVSKIDKMVPKTCSNSSVVCNSHVSIATNNKDGGAAFK